MTTLAFDHASERHKGHVTVPRGVHVRKLGKCMGMTVYRVDGEKIRRDIFIDFVFGGTAARYKFIPDKEIWLEQIMSPNDATATLLHEYVEYLKMTTGSHLSYEHAHDKASAAEIKLREKLARRKLRRVDLRMVEKLMGKH